ncbi:MAG: hypothetical protein CMJ58_17280 [Planctomycetaceae bacterium]|nr:hypothetical protein [Planctomycetaceae bacterium]
MIKAFNTRLAWIVILLTVTVSVVDTVRLYPQLPQNVASHFDAGGNPNGWGSKQSFVAIMLGTLTGLAALGGVAEWMIRRGPRAMINVPHKDKWLAPEHEASTRADMAHTTVWIIAATTLFLAFMTHDALAANLRDPVHMKSMWLTLTGLLATVGWLTLRMTLRYRKPPTA